MTDVRMPELGESITSGTITKWFKAPGETIVAEEPLFEVSTEKVDAEVPSPFSGTIGEILVVAGTTVDVGTVVATLETSDAPAPPAPAPTSSAVTPAPAVSNEVPVPASLATAPVSTAVAAAPDAPTSPVVAQAQLDNLLITSPVVRKLVKQLGADASLVHGTGPNGRVTRKDAELIATQSSHHNGAAALTSTQAGFIPFNKTRKVTGDKMVASKAISPHVLSAIEVDYENIERVRRERQDAWKAAEGFTLTYLPFIARALVQTLGEFPLLNASVVPEGVVVHDNIDLNIAVDLNFEGLLAPVVRKVRDKRLGAIAREIADLAGRARTKKLQADELSGGTFTISNSGPFGTFMVAPIINQPQVAILSTDGVTRKPVVVTDEFGGEAIAIHSVGMLVLSWDHRAFDGAYAAAFLRALKNTLERHDWRAEF
jgi:pyruvate dehydrogenase E2 component (dihydrolipoamide acetyltransferase)